MTASAISIDGVQQTGLLATSSPEEGGDQMDEEENRVLTSLRAVISCSCASVMIMSFASCRISWLILASNQLWVVPTARCHFLHCLAW